MLLSLVALTGLPAAHPDQQLCSETSAVITSHLQGFSPFAVWVRGDLSMCCTSAQMCSDRTQSFSHQTPGSPCTRLFSLSLISAFEIQIFSKIKEILISLFVLLGCAGSEALAAQLPVPAGFWHVEFHVSLTEIGISSGD